MGLSKLIKRAAPIITAVAAPYAIPAMAGALGIGTIGAGALYGAGASKLTGGDVGQGALLGGLSGGLGGAAGEQVNQLTGLNLSPANQVLAGNTLLGGVGGMLNGQGAMRGALGAASGTALGNAVSGLAGNGAGTALGQGLTAAGQTIGNMTSAGLPYKQALTGGALSGLLAAGMTGRPSGGVSSADPQKIQQLLADPDVPETTKEVFRNYQRSSTFDPASMSAAGPGYDADPLAAKLQAAGAATDFGLNAKTAGVALMALSPLALEELEKAQTPQQVTQAMSNSPYFRDLRLQSWDWDALQAQARAAGEDLGTYVARNWDKVTESTRYTSPARMAAGGALNRLAMGGGGGREDTIDARLSDGEYVMDAETVALLGDGSVKEGANRLDGMRAKIRQHKGKALAKGKISPDAKSPLAYLKGVA